MADLGTAYVRIAPNMTGIQGKVARGFKGAAGPATKKLGAEVNSNSGPFKGAVGKLGGIAKGAGIAIAGGLAAGAAGIAALTGKALMAGAELEQQLGGAEAVFGKYADGIKDKAKEAYKTAGLSQTEFLQGANKMGSLFQGAGFDVEKSMSMSSESMQRASDIASIMGISTTDALTAVTGMAKGNFTMMDNLGVAMNDTAIGAFALSKGINKTTGQMSIQEKVGLAQQMFMEKTAKFAGNYAKENDTLSGSLNTTKKAFDNFLSGEGDVNEFIDSLVNTIDIAIPQLVSLMPRIVDGLSSILEALIPAFAEALPVLIPALIGAAKSLIQALVTAMPTVVQALLQALPTLIGAFVTLFISLLQALPQIVSIIAQAMPTIIDALVTGLTNPEALNAIIFGTVDLFLAIVDAIPLIIPPIIDAMPLIISNIVDTLTSPAFISKMIGAGFQLIKGLIKGIVRTVGSVGSAMGKIIGKIGEILAPSKLAEIGGNAIKGIWEGMKGLGNWLKDNIINLVKDKIPGPVKKVLGINSPSKLFAGFGKNIDEGLAQGVSKHAGMVEKSVTNMAESAMSGVVKPAINPAVAFGTTGGFGPGSGPTSNTNQTVSIGNVVLGDQSAVKEFFKQLNQDTINVGMGITPIQGAQ